MKTVTAATLALMLGVAGSAALAQTPMQPERYMPPRTNSVRPNSQNLMQGPSYWTPQQRRLNVPGADNNPSLRRETGPYPPQPIPPDAPARPAETPDKPKG